jgi:hypothetical protein
MRVRIQPDPEGGDEDRRLVVQVPQGVALVGEVPASAGSEGGE